MRFVALILAAAALAGPADAFRAQNGKEVSQIDASSFRVDWSGSSGAPSFWCAAGDYAIRGLNLPTATQIYRYTPPIRQQGESIVFGLDPARAASTGLLRAATGAGVPAIHARQLCD